MAGKRKKGMSYSKINCYDSCGFQYYLKYVCGKYLFKDNVANTFGSLVHYILEQEANCIREGRDIDYEQLKNIFLHTDKSSIGSKDKEQIWGIDEIAKRFPVEWHKLSDKSGKSYEQKAQDFLRNGIYDFPIYMDEHPELEVVGAEVPFEFEYSDYKFNGFIDLVLHNKETGAYIVWDTKTKDHKFSDKETTTPLQFVCYCHALQLKYGENAIFECYYYLPVIRELQPAGTKGFMQRGLKKIDKLLDGINNSVYEPRPTPLCYWCEFCNANPNVTDEGKNLCPYYSLWTPDDRKNFKTKLPWLGMDKHFIQVGKLEQLQAIESADEDDELFDI